LHLCCSVSDPPLQAEDPSQPTVYLSAAELRKKAAAFEWSRRTIFR